MTLNSLYLRMEVFRPCPGAELAHPLQEIGGARKEDGCRDLLLLRHTVSLPHVDPHLGVHQQLHAQAGVLVVGYFELNQIQMYFKLSNLYYLTFSS